MRLRVYFTGGLRRFDIGARCGTIAAASRDLESGQDIVPKNLDRDLASRCHRPARIRCWRSTALAETFFTDQAIVDSRLKTDFFKHLPGVLTGLGIIGTFLGLIKGLVHFDVSVDPAAAQASVW
ncbi:hypothetical protein WS95_18650 [Burkholderia sp. MSMB1826]|nr:hypothetical protein WS95_18650 [Burkholderia sp. MSMB1826]